MIIKSLIKDENLIEYAFINSKDWNDDRFDVNLFHNVKLEFLQKLNFKDFKDWHKRITDKDDIYIKNLEYYGFRFVFNKNSIIWENKSFYPIFPWITEFKKRNIPKTINREKIYKYKNKLAFRYIFKK